MGRIRNELCVAISNSSSRLCPQKHRKNKYKGGYGPESHKKFLGVSNKNLRISKTCLGNSKKIIRNDLEISKKCLGNSKKVIGTSNRIIGSSKKIIGISNKFLRNSKNILDV